MLFRSGSLEQTNLLAFAVGVGFIDRRGNASLVELPEAAAGYGAVI